MRRHVRDRVRRDGNRGHDWRRMPQAGGRSERRPDRERAWSRMRGRNLRHSRSRCFQRHRLCRGLYCGHLGGSGGGQDAAILLRSFVFFGRLFLGLRCNLGRPSWSFPTRTRKALAQQFSNILIHRAGMGFLFGHPEFRQEVQNRARFDLELPRQLIDANLLHTHGRILSASQFGPRPQADPIAPASPAAGQL